MHIPDKIRKCAVFLGRPRPPLDFVPTATAFVVHAPTRDGTFAAPYLVTVKHFADRTGTGKFGVRLNLQDGGTKTIFADRPVTWWHHPSEPESVDAAVCPWYPGDEDICSIPTDMFITDEHLRQNVVGPGDEVYMIGLFTRLAATPIEPVVRTGNIAAIPRSPIPKVTVSGKLVDAESYVIEVRSMGGLSGCPVFATETFAGKVTRLRGPEKGKEAVVFYPGSFYFLGLMQGHWQIPPEDHDRHDFQGASLRDRPDAIALGMSLVVPAKKILEIINRPELVQEREEAALTQIDTTSSE
jgi:hypothetical protein